MIHKQNYIMSHFLQNSEKIEKTKERQSFQNLGHLEIDYVWTLLHPGGKNCVIVGINKAIKYCWAKAVKHPNANDTDFLKILFLTLSN